MTEEKIQRKIRNFLLDKRFQLKYTLAVVVVTVIISLVLGYFLYKSHNDIQRANEELFSAHKELYQTHRENSKLIELQNIELEEAIAAELKKKDDEQRAKYEATEKKNAKIMEGNRNILLVLTMAFGAFVFAIAVVGIIATHKIAGPAYAMRRTLQRIADGRLPKVRSLRKGDELKAVAEELRRMAENLRSREEREIGTLKDLQAALKDRASSEVLSTLQQVILQKEQRIEDEPKSAI